MVSRENQVLVVSGVIALAVLFALRAFTNVGPLSRLVVVVVAILVTQSALDRVSQ